MKPTAVLRSGLPLAALLAAYQLQAATIYWDGGTANWSTLTAWSTNSANATPDPGTIPGSADDLIFNRTGNNAAGNTVSFANGDRAARSMTFNTTGASNFRAGGNSGVAVSLTLGSAGITVNSGAGAVTISQTPSSYGTITTILAAAQSWTNNSSNTLTVEGPVTNGGFLLTLAGTGNTTINGAIGGTGGLTMNGTGTLRLTGANGYTGTTTINAGTLNLGSGTGNGSLASTALTLGGGTFSYTRTGTNAQSFTSGTTVNAGASAVTTDNASNTINLGALTRTAPGGVLSIGATGNITTTTANTNGILGGWAVFNNAGTVTNWAFSPGSGLDITGGVTYDATSTLLDSAAAYANKNVDVNSSQTPDAAINANSLRFHAGSAQTLTLQGNNTLVSGGILVTNTTGNAPTITGGTLAGSASGDLIVHQYNTTNGLTIDSQIVNNGGATALTKAGPGLLTLNGNNTFTGGVFIHAGRLALGNAGAFNSTTPNNVTFGSGSTGTLSLGGNSVTIPVLSTNATSAGSTIIENAAATNATLTINSTSNSTFAGVIQDGAGTGTLALTKSGSGTLTLSNANTYSGGTTLSGGTVAISNATALGAGSVSVTGNSRINAAALTYTNAIDITGTNVLSLQNTGAASSTATFSGAITGTSGGGVTLVPGPSGAAYTVSLTNTNNTFTGNLTLSATANANDFINFASIGDGGSIVFGRTGWRSVASYTGSAALPLSTRTISLASSFGGFTTSGPGLDGGGSPINMFANNGAGVVTMSSAMAVTAPTASGVFYFGGTSTGDNTFSGLIADISGTPTLGIGKWDAGKWIISNSSNSFAGNVYIGNGTLSAPNIQALGNGSVIQLGLGNTTGTLEYTGSVDASTTKQTVIGNLANNNHSGGATILSNGTTGTLSFTNSTFNSLVVPWGATFAVTTVDRTLTLGGTNTGANTISGTIQDNVTGAAQVLLSKTGIGKWVLSGNNTYTGGTTLSSNGGILAISHASALGTGTVHNATTNSATSGSTLQLDFTVPVSGTGSSAVTPNVIANNFTFNSQNLLAAGGFANIQNVSGFNRIGGNLTISGTGGTGANIVSDSGHLELAGNLTTTQTGNRAFNFGGSGNGTVSGIISNGTGTVPVTKSGAGTWTLSNANNSYTGATNVDEGTLVVNGNISTSSLTTVKNTATLKGSGTVGALTVQGGGTLAPGTSIESLASGNLTLLADAIFQQEIDDAFAGGNAAGDLTAVTGTFNLALTNDSVLDLVEIGSSGLWSAGHKITLISYTGLWNGGLFEYLGNVLNDQDKFMFSGIEWEFNYDDDTAGSNFTDDLTGSTFVTMTAVPEPRAALLGSLGVLLLLRRRRD